MGKKNEFMRIPTFYDGRMGISVYHKIASLFTARDIAREIGGVVEAEMGMMQLFESYEEDMDTFFLVKDANKTIGFIHGHDDWVEGQTAIDVYTPLTPDIIVPDSLKLIDLIRLFTGERYFLFIITGNEISHYVSFNIIDMPPLRLSFSALYEALEARILSILSRYPSKHLMTLSEGRKEKAKARCIEKYSFRNPWNTLLSTTIADRLDMLRADKDILSKLPFDSNTEIKTFNKCIENVRNMIAHGETMLHVFDYNPERLNNHINRLLLLVKTLGNVFDGLGAYRGQKTQESEKEFYGYEEWKKLHSKWDV